MPASPLDHFVRRIRLYSAVHSRPHARRMHVPHRDVNLVLSLGGSFEVCDSSGVQRSFPEGEGFVAGLHTTPAWTDAFAQRGVEVSLTPIGAHLLLGGVPMHAVANRVRSLEELLGAPGRELGQRLGESEGRDDAFAILERFFAARILNGGRAVAPGVAEAWRMLDASHGAVRIGHVAGTLGWSRKRLLGAFRDAVGLPPKTLAQVLRFRRVLELLTGSPEARWSELAQDCGYHDQAHLARAVRRFTGRTPGELARQMVPDEDGWSFA